MDMALREKTWSKPSRGGVPPRKPSPLSRCSSWVAMFMETIFYRLGRIIGQYPVVVMAGCLVSVAVCGGGIAFLYEETAQQNLWTPKNSQAAADKLWVEENFGNKTIRRENILLVADNVLEPAVLAVMLQLDKAVKALKDAGSYDWESLCERLGSSCWANSLLELWSYDEAVINSLTKQQILDKVNTPNLRSPVYFNQYDVDNVLGNVQRNSSGYILSAEATLLTWVLKYNETQAELDKELAWETKFLELAEKWKEEEESKTIPTVKELYYFAFRSRSDEIGGAIFGDLQLLAMGYIIVLVFVALVMGKFNCMEQKIFVTLSGILCVGFSTVVAIGLCSYCGVFFGPLHNVLPFLLLGIGVDDMFVIGQSLENIKSENHGKDLPVHEKIALALKHAGVSITVTSLTDALAFGVGASTILPALQSFCVYAVVGVLALLVYQALFFTSCLTLDLRRQQAGRNACCLCYTHGPRYRPNQCSQTELIPTFFSRFYGPFLMKTPVKAVVMAGSVVMVGVMAWGATSLKQDADPNQFYPGDSYAYKYIEASAKYFPGDGYPTAIYLGDFNYHTERADLEKLYQNVVSDPYTYPGTVRSWHQAFHVWLGDQAAANVSSVLTLTDNNFFPSSEPNFYTLLQAYMCTGTREGARFTADIVFNVDSICSPGSTTTSIKSSRLSLKHKKLEDSKEEILAMESLRKITEESDLPQDEIRIYTRVYLRFEGNKVIQNELFRNLGLAFMCVAIMTLILIADIWMCLLVCLCVLMTLVDLVGMVYYWGLTIDSVTTIQFILAIGLAVDYAVHIAHTYMTIAGDREYRTRKTLHRMGSAVFYGGFSTFLAFILLSASSSYVFQAFFKETSYFGSYSIHQVACVYLTLNMMLCTSMISSQTAIWCKQFGWYTSATWWMIFPWALVFFGVVVFGLFHGLAFLPCLLSIFGPSPYLSAYSHIEKNSDSSSHTPQGIQQKKAYLNTLQDSSNYIPYVIPSPMYASNGVYNGFSHRTSQMDYHRPPVHSSNSRLYTGSHTQLYSSSQQDLGGSRHYPQRALFHDDLYSSQADIARQGSNMDYYSRNIR